MKLKEWLENLKSECCGLCGESFYFASSRDNHIKVKHPWFAGQTLDGSIIYAQGYTCYCGKGFTSKADLFKHKTSEHTCGENLKATGSVFG